MLGGRDIVRGTEIAVAMLLFLASTAMLTQLASSGAALAQAPTSCPNYGGNNVVPPEKIRVRIAGTNIVQEVDFKNYAKDVLPNEWLANWDVASYQAGAMAVKTFGWNWTINWRNDGLHYVAETGECFDVWSDERDQVYVASSSTLPTAYAVEQTWNWLLLNNGAIYPAHHNSGYPDDYCGETHPQPGLYAGSTMSQYGSQACADNDYTWPQIVNTYYFNNAQNPPLYQGDHIYGQWHGAMGWGPEPWTPVSVSPSAAGYSTWKFKWSNTCGGYITPPFDYGTASDIKVVGDWDGNGSHTQGVVVLSGGLLHWSLRNTRNSGGVDYSFTYGAYGDIPVVGDWDGNGTWTPGVYHGSKQVGGGAAWVLRNLNSGGPENIVASWGDVEYTPMPGEWKATYRSQPVTLGLVRLEQVGGGQLKWLLSYSNTQPAINQNFNWGPWWGRPITGDWRSGDNSTRFGPGFVTDEPPDACTNPPPNQGWTLKYTPGAGGVDLQFRYDFVRP